MLIFLSLTKLSYKNVIFAEKKDNMRGLIYCQIVHNGYVHYKQQPILMLQIYMSIDNLTHHGNF